MSSNLGMDVMHEQSLTDLHSHVLRVLSRREHSILPARSCILAAEESMCANLRTDGHGIQETIRHLLEDIAPGLNASSLSSRYFGFVTGGVNPAALIADNLVTLYDQNVQVHLPDQSVATKVEDCALMMLMDLVKLIPSEWTGRTFTTGATSSNILGLACGREQVVNLATGSDGNAVSRFGILRACKMANLDEIVILTTMPHSSLKKAASVVGLGHDSVIDVGQKHNKLRFDMTFLQEQLDVPCRRCVVVISCGEVNTGGFATVGKEECLKLRKLCDRYGAWLHVDAGRLKSESAHVFGLTMQPLASLLEYLKDPTSK